MSKIIERPLLFLLAACTLFSCQKEEQVTVPIAPIIKYVVMPNESEAIPGTDVTIAGVGFASGDSIICTSLEGEPSFSPEVVKVTDYAVILSVPKDAGGSYQVSVTRANLTTVLDGTLKIAYVIYIKDLKMPTGILKPGETVSVTGEGFENEDLVKFGSSSYPSGCAFTSNALLTDDGISFNVPQQCYGVNTLTLVRGKKICSLGELDIAVDVGDELGGGIVYYTSDDGVHGLISAMGHIGSNTEYYGPSIPSSYASGTSADIYTGKTNTASLVSKFASYIQDGNTYSGTTAAGKCDQYTFTVDTLSYDDWFLPSQDELIEMFKVKDMLRNKGVDLPANNYWTSTEYDYSAGWVWAHYYVNFYESTNIVSDGASVDGWTIGIMPIRQF
ncbi:MAG: DUF1566 domain-containing protein [Bacteroidales bacterium]|jgi:hypothetical protein|nr:DUF1566 domain-containing protein [Bacteroidales bacterium]MCI2121643.1 DUF1566 domain-containing protein [Bacteroidales bacterium]MCI2144957.1 DUF1566 domain-containing protein [Bacteroidales bacterium]